MVKNWVMVCLLLEMLSMIVFILGGVGAIFQWFQRPLSNGLLVGGLISICVVSAVLLCLMPFYEETERPAKKVEKA